MIEIMNSVKNFFQGFVIPDSIMTGSTVTDLMVMGSDSASSTFSSIFSTFVDIQSL